MMGTKEYTIFKECKLLIASPEPTQISTGQSILVKGNQINRVGQYEELISLLPPGSRCQTIDCRHKLVMPGLIDGHNHLCNTHMNLARIFSMDYENIAKHQFITVHDPYGWHTEESLFKISLCSATNALKHGATTIVNCTILPDTAYQAMTQTGMRGILAPQIATSFMLDADRLDGQMGLSLTERCIRDYHKPDDNFSVVVHVHDTWDCLDSTIVKAYEMAEQYDTKFVTHFYEFPKAAELEDSLWAKEGGGFEHYYNMEILTDRTVLFHGCMLNEERLDALGLTGASIIHNPDINATNCGNCAYVPHMFHAGINVGLGSDCGALDMFGAMKLMLLVHNIMPRKLRKIEYHEPFQAATINNAKAYGLSEQVGTLEEGKRADIITIDLSRSPDLVPLTTRAIEYSPDILFFLLIRSIAGKETCETMVDGKLIRADHEFTFLDEEKIVAEAAQMCDRFLPDLAARYEQGLHFAERIYPDFVCDDVANEYLEELRNV